MRSIIVLTVTLSLIAFTVSVAQDTCIIVNCSDTVTDTNTGVCGKAATTSGKKTITLNECKSGYACTSALAGLIAYTDGASYNCSAFNYSVSASTNLAAGQECSSNSNCYKDCVDKKCNGLAAGTTCTVDLDCAVGLSCISSKCTAQRAVGEACTTDYNCVNDAGCSNGKCMKYKSIENGNDATSLDFCKYQNGYVKTSTTGTTYTCDQVTLSSSKCTGTDDTCTYKYTKAATTFNSSCVCSGYGSDRERECTAVSGVKEYQTGVHTTLRVKTTSTNSSYSSDYTDCIGNSLFSEKGWEIIKNGSAFMTLSLSALAIVAALIL